MESGLCLEVPPNLKKLLRCVTRAFYSSEHCIIIDFLIIHPCVKEEDMMEVLKYEKKQLRALINTFKQEKIIKERLRVETDIEKKTTRHSYYFINYSVFVNVLKYKLDMMRQKIEHNERDATSRSSFHCPSCKKQYTDLDADQLFNPMLQIFQCTFCKDEVMEQEGSNTQKDAQNLIVKFNQQMQILFDLLKEVEHIKLAPSLLEPEPEDVLEKIKSHRSAAAKKAKVDVEHIWSGERKRVAGFNYIDTEVKVNMQEEGVVEDVKPVKERPVWLTESTIATPEPDYPPVDEIKASALMSLSEIKEEPMEVRTKEDDEIMKTLLANETKKKPVTKGPLLGLDDSGDDAAESSSSDSDDENMSNATSRQSGSQKLVGEARNQSSSEEEETVVLVQGRKVAFYALTDELIAKMSAEEKENYIKLSREMYDDYF